MWYLTETCSPLEALIPGGHVFGDVEKMEIGNSLEVQKAWESLSNMCCRSVPGAP